ncbi:MAG TPA: MATE family efflux transporter [Opitutaceae bacterium]|nr:MATE family efflux transporter [Opitutaceae bacterium]
MSTFKPSLAELRPTFALALPITVGQVSQILMGLTDSAMVGHVGRVPLAAAAFAGSVFGMFFVVGAGLLVPVSVLVARAHGAGRPDDCGRWLRHGLAVALAVGLSEALAIAILSTQLHRFGQPAEVVAAVNPFFIIVGVSLIPAFLFQALRQFSEAQGRPWQPMTILFLAVGLNALGNWVFIFGHWGAPALGLTGSGCSTLLARFVSVIALWVWLRRQPALRPLLPRPRDLLALSGARLREMFSIGLPVTGQLLFEVGAFSTAALMMGWLGTVPLAAHQIALSCAAFTFMFPLGLSTAVSIRLSEAVGRGRHEALRPIGFGALGLSTAMMGAFALVFLLAGGWIARGFTTDPDVATLAARLLLVAAVFQIFDGGQVVGLGALRGLTDVRIPMVITFIAYWLVALPGAYLLGFPARFGAPGIWAGLAAGLACAAVLLASRLARATGQRLPAAVPAG